MTGKFTCLLPLFLALHLSATPDWLSSSKLPNAFPLAQNEVAAAIFYDTQDATVVSIAAQHLQQDIKTVTGFTPQLNPTQATAAKIYLGTLGQSVTTYPVDVASLDPSSASPYLEYTIQIEEAGDYHLQADLLPTFPVNGQSDLRLAFSIDDSPPVLATLTRDVNDDVWKEAVLSASVKLTAAETFNLTADSHQLRI